jgi:hypothetical protein
MIYFAKLPSSFVQKRLFNYFSYERFSYTGRLTDPFENLNPIINDIGIHLKKIFQLCEK